MVHSQVVSRQGGYCPVRYYIRSVDYVMGLRDIFLAFQPAFCVTRVCTLFNGLLADARATDNTLRKQLMEKAGTFALSCLFYFSQPR